MKKKYVVLLVMAVLLCVASPSQAALSVRGVDTNGNRLIYDSSLNITWYDFSNQQAGRQRQMNWASNLSVAVNGQSVSGWRLPTAGGNPGTGYNLNTSADEMGYLYYLTLGNKGIYDVNGNMQTGWGLLNKGPFRSLVSTGYWSGSSGGTGDALYFKFSTGWQSGNTPASAYLALAVHNGDIVPTPIPGTFWLLGSGLSALLGMSRKKSSLN